MMFTGRGRLFWGGWGRTWQRWEREGKPPEIRDHRSFLSPDSPPQVVPVNYGPCPQFDRKVLSSASSIDMHGC